MNISNLRKRLLQASVAAPALAIAGFGLSAPANAQAPADCPDTNDDGICDDESEVTSATGEDTGSQIIVTGSRTRRSNFNTSEPLTVISRDDITQSGFASTADALQDTSVTQGSSQINNYYGGFVTDGGPGANTLSLRALGPARTLVLLNGRRLAPAGTRGSLLSADLNVLPNAIVERVEILKSGASSVYGSDAVAGVVNIITDSMFEGLTLEGQVNVPENGAGVEKRLAAVVGHSSDRFSFVGSVEWYKRDGLALRDVDWASCPIGGFIDGEGSPLGSDDYIDPNTGQPACFTLDNGGVTINTLGVPTRDAQDRLTGAVGRYNRLVPNSAVVAGPTPGFSGVDFYTRDTFDPRSQDEYIITPTENYTGFLSASYELDILGHAEVYGEILATQRKSSNILYRQLSLDYSQGSLLIPEAFRNGAFLNPNDISNGNIVAARAFIGFGNTSATQNVDYARASGGVRGDFVAPGWRYDLWLGKSWTDGDYSQETFLTDRIAQSLDVVQNDDGSFSCASQGVNPNCVAAPPLNADTIGGNLPQNYRDYILSNEVGNTKFREFIASFVVDGPLFPLPGGDSQVALGVEYRSSRINDTPSENAINGNLFNLTSGAITRGSDKVYEGFGEIYLPLLADVPGAYELSLTASGRYTEYDSYGGDFTYKVSGTYSPFRGVGFRGSYGTSFRAPALSEQFLGATSGFLASNTDPCDDLQPDSNNIIIANCAAIGIGLGEPQTSGVTVLSAGGAGSGLNAETSTNWSAGVILTPPLPESIGSLEVAVDYFNIKVKNGVAQVGGGAILGLCYGDPSFNPDQGFCRLVDRDENNVVTVNDNFVNIGTEIRKGWEFSLRYSTDIGPGQLTLSGLATMYTEQSSKLFPDDPLEDANGIVTQPDFVADASVRYRIDNVTVRYGVDYIDSGRDDTYEYFALVDGVVDPDLEQSYRDAYYLEVNDYFTHDASIQVNIDDVEITAGVRNIFDKQPPRITSIGFNTIVNAPLYSGYDYRGRTFFLNTTVGF